MKDIDKKALNNVLKRAQLQKSTGDLTNNVMQQISLNEESTDEQTWDEQELIFSQMLKQGVLKAPSPQLQVSIMSAIKKQHNKQFTVEPLVSKKVKLTYLVVSVIAVVYLLIHQSVSLPDSVMAVALSLTQSKVYMLCIFYALFALIMQVLIDHKLFKKTQAKVIN